MHPNQQPPIYTTRHYIHDPQSNSRNINEPSRALAPPYPYYTNNQPPTSVTYINDRPNYGQQPPQSYAPQNTNYYPRAQPPPQPSPPSQNNFNRNNYAGPAGGGGGGGGGIEKTNTMSNESPFHDPARRYEQSNAPRTVTSITSPPKGDGGTNNTLNLSEESPFHDVYGGYHYPTQVDPTKRITQQSSAARSTDNKSLNLSDESPFFSTYGRYHYPSQIDPQKRITEMPKAAAPLSSTNAMSNENPFSNYSAGPGPDPYSSGNNYSGPPPPPPHPNRYNQGQNPPPNYYNQPQPSSMRPPSPPVQQSSARPQLPKVNPSAPQDKTSMNMSADNPFAATYGQYHYPSADEIKSQKKANDRMNRYGDQQPVNNNRPGPSANNQMSEYPETEKKEIISGKGNTKFARFDVG
ncbi:hypothetical protein I4U23_025787 [Adineta vaga]|nr:hypothetical protein I4U23_025787 [Adineta vaga]